MKNKYNDQIIEIINQQQRLSMNKQSILYLKQFFNNFTIRQQHTDLIHLVNSSMEVLEDLISQFIVKHSIRIPNNLQLPSKNQSFHSMFQRVYICLNVIIQWVGNTLQDRQSSNHASTLNDIQSQSSTRQKISWDRTGDEELYQILNEYKSANKKLKQNVQSLTQKLDAKNNDALQIKIAKQIAQKQQTYLNSRLQQLEKQNNNLKQQLILKNQQLVCCQKQIKDFNKQLGQKCSQIGGLQNKLRQVQNEVKKWQQSYSKICEQKQRVDKRLGKILDEQTSNIKQKLAQIPDMIEQKMKVEKVYTKPTVEVLKKFIKFSIVNKQYGNPNSLEVAQNPVIKIHAVT